MASSSNSSVQKSFKYDVFLSFRGEDTRKTFVGHLNYALQQKSIHTYKDDERIKKGNKISDDLIKSIEDSRFHIIVFSKNYASSSWCLAELVKIMECQKMPEQTAYPVFYDVEPTEVRHQTGEFGEVFAKNEKEEDAGKWREALEEAASLAGWELKNTNDGDEAKFIQKIVEEISLELRCISFSVDEKLVGMKTRIKDVVSSLEMGFDDVRMIGIKGMGGGGKTTLARAVFDHISFQFEGSSFVENVRENSNPNFSGLKKLQKQVLKDVLNDRGINISNVHDGKKMMKKMMHCRKVLVVLDDVDHTKQLEALAGELNWFNKGSRIIITTRDEQVLIAHRVNLIRDVNLLSHEEALCLFSRYAFGREIPIQGYEELSSQVILYAAGLPLTVSVLGSFLCGKIELEWESAIQRLKTIPSKDTLDILEISYIGLEEEHKEIFLDVACILKGWEKEDAIRALESCGFYARIGLKVLEQKSLITISKYGELDMHDRIEEMGKYIVRRTHEEPNKHSRLWIKQEIEDILVSDQGTNEAIRCIKIMKTSKLNPEIVMKGLGNIEKLRFLQMWCGDNNWEFDEVWQYFPNALRCLRWTQLPPLFSKCKIVQLRQGGDRKVLNNLRFLDISGSKLKNLDLGLTPNLERLYITYCYYLVELHMPAECPKLISLKLGYSKLTTLVFPKTPNLETLSVLSCYDLVELHIPIQCLNLKSIYINGSRVRTLDLRGTPNLETLSVVKCSHLEELHIPVKYLKLKSICICNSKLRTLDLQGTPNLETLTLAQCVDLQLHIPIKCLKLKSIDIYNSKLRTLDLQETLNLETLSVKESYDLVQLQTPVECLKLESIDICGSKLRTLDLRAAQNLKVLTVKGCYDLVELHTPVECLKLESVDIDGSKLRTLDLRAAQNLKILTVKGCYDLVELHTPVVCLKLESIVIGGSKLRILDLRAAQNLKVSAYSNLQRGEPSGQYQNQSEPRSYGSPSAVNWEMASPKEQSLTAPAYMPREETNGSGKPKDSGSAMQVDRSSDDGYNWRKYGQKVVKGSEHSRSYYKCTHPNCEVKKCFERSYTGQITEIVYKGTHDHPKPQPSRRFSSGALMSIQEENADKAQYATYQAGLSNNGQNPNFEASGTPVQSPRQGNQDSTDGSSRPLNRTNDEVDDDDDPYSKKRRTDFGALDVTPVVKPIREPRVVVQTTSEVDILDDGHRWRKYGQKVERGNPNPRSYYKCTSAECTVRKHVERASHDPKAVITAYEGKHNHDVPVVKNRNHDATISGISRTRSEENDALCLDLVVGNRIPDQQPPQNAATLHSQVHVSNSNFRKVVHWNDVYGTTTDNEVEGCNVDSTTLNHSSNPYPQNLGRILLGP